MRSRDVMSVDVLIDVSDSITARQRRAYIADTCSNPSTAKPQPTKPGLIVFGKTPAVELPPRTSFPVRGAQLAARPRRDEHRAGAVAGRGDAARGEPGPDRADQRRRRRPRAACRAMLDELKSRGIAVDVLPIEYTYTQRSLAGAARTAAGGEARRDLRSGDGAVVADRRRREAASCARTARRSPSRRSNYKPGKNRFIGADHAARAGLLRIHGHDRSPEARRTACRRTTRVLNYIFVEGEGKVLLVTDPQGDQRDWEKLRAGDPRRPSGRSRRSSPTTCRATPRRCALRLHHLRERRRTTPSTRCSCRRCTTRSTTSASGS